MNEVTEFDQTVWDLVHKLVPDIKQQRFGPSLYECSLVIKPFMDFHPEKEFKEHPEYVHNFRIGIKLNGMYCIVDYEMVPSCYYHRIQSHVVDCQQFCEQFDQIVTDIKRWQENRNLEIDIPSKPAPTKVDFCQEAIKKVNNFV